MFRVFVDRFQPGDVGKTLRAGWDWARLESVVFSGAKVFVRPNFTYPSYKEGVTSSPAVIEELVRLLPELNAHVTIGESDGGSNAWKAEEAFAGHGGYQLQKRYGCRAVNLSTLPAAMIEVSWRGQCRQIPMPSVLLQECHAQ